MPSIKTLSIKRRVKTVTGCRPDAMLPEVLESREPLILKGLAADWPIVQAAERSPEQAAEYLLQFDGGAPLTVFLGPPENHGRVFYNDDLTGFNFQSTRMKLPEVLDKLLQYAGADAPPSVYVGSTMIDKWLPGFRRENDLTLEGLNPLVSIWLGNKSRIAAHFDFPNNIACSVSGHRRFILFPPDQLENLYIGPLEFTPAGQPISLVDFNNPDFRRFPRFRKAIKSARVAELAPGDAVFIPGMWWHHVEGLASLNILVNYWWRDTPAYMGAPLNVLYHAMLGLHDLPPEQRKVWQHIFDYYVFRPDAATFQHVPEQARGMLSGIDEDTARRIRMLLLERLKN